MTALLYIGGASSTSRLLRCQTVDGEGMHLPMEFLVPKCSKFLVTIFSTNNRSIGQSTECQFPRLNFRKWLPHMLCHDSLQVEVIGSFCAICYGLVIPCCFVYLYFKQHQVLRPGGSTVAASIGHENLEVRLVELRSSATRI